MPEVKLSKDRLKALRAENIKAITAARIDEIEKLDEQRNINKFDLSITVSAIIMF